MKITSIDDLVQRSKKSERVYMVDTHTGRREYLKYSDVLKLPMVIAVNAIESGLLFVDDE